MRKIALFAVAAICLIGAGFGVWAAAPSNARIAPASQTIDPLQLMTNVKGLPTEETVD